MKFQHYLAPGRKGVLRGEGLGALAVANREKVNKKFQKCPIKFFTICENSSLFVFPRNPPR